MVRELAKDFITKHLQPQESNYKNAIRTFKIKRSSVKRDKVSLDIFWLRDESLEESENLPEPDVIAAEITENLEAALEQFASIYEEIAPSEDGAAEKHEYVTQTD